MKKMYLIIVLMLTIFNIVGCNDVDIKDEGALREHTNTLQEHNYHKDVDVIVTNIQMIWAGTNYKSWRISFKSEEYNLTGETEVSGAEPLGVDIYYGSLQVGDTLKATLYTKTIGDEVVNRRLGNLVK